MATLWSGAAQAGRSELVARAPHGLAPGLYLARLEANGRAIAVARVALLR